MSVVGNVCFAPVARPRVTLTATAMWNIHWYAFDIDSTSPETPVVGFQRFSTDLKRRRGRTSFQSWRISDRMFHSLLLLRVTLFLRLGEKNSRYNSSRGIDDDFRYLTNGSSWVHHVRHNALNPWLHSTRRIVINTFMLCPDCFKHQLSRCFFSLKHCFS